MVLNVIICNLKNSFCAISDDTFKPAPGPHAAQALTACGNVGTQNTKGACCKSVNLLQRWGLQSHLLGNVIRTLFRNGERPGQLGRVNPGFHGAQGVSLQSVLR